MDPTVGYKQHIGLEHIYMTTNVTEENKQAAFELLKWMTYGEEGVVEAFKIKEDYGNNGNKIYIPPTHAPKVKEIIENSDIPQGFKFVYENLGESIPTPWPANTDFGVVISEVIDPKMNEILYENGDAASIVVEMETRANKIMDEAWVKLRDAMSKFDIYK